MHRHGTLMVLFLAGVLMVMMMKNVSGQSPGAKLQLSQTGLNYAASVAVDKLSTIIKDQQIPELSGTAKVVVGKVDYTVNGVKIESFTKPSSIVTVNAGTGMTWTMSNAGLFATGNWAYKYKVLFVKFSDRGTFELTIGGASASLTVTLGKDSNGRPTISVLGCSCSISSVKVKFRGGASWIYNLFSGFVQNPIRSAIEKAVCNAATKTINTNGAQQLATLKTSVTLANQFVIDYRLVENPLFASGYIQSSHKGEVFYTGDLSEAPFSARPIPTSTPNRMLTASVSEYVINTLGHVLHQRGILSYVLTKNDVPVNSRNFFATDCVSGTCFGTLFPDVASLYPNSFVELNMRTTTRPTLTIVSNSAVGTFQGEINIAARKPDGTQDNLLTIRVSVSFSVTAGISGNYITGTVTNFSPSITVMNSTLLDLPQVSLNELLEGASNAFIVPKLNQVGQRGFAIPSIDRVNLIGPSLKFIDGAVVVSADVAYIP